MSSKYLYIGVLDLKIASKYISYTFIKEYIEIYYVVIFLLQFTISSVQTGT